MSKNCSSKSKYANDPDYICNPWSGRWVKKSGKIGQHILESQKVAALLLQQKGSTTSKAAPAKKKTASKSKLPKASATLHPEGVAALLLQQKGSTTSKAAAPAKKKTASKRKSPTVSATLHPEGTEMKGNDGRWYVIRIRKNGSHYWAPCANKTSSCENQDGGRATHRRSQRGGRKAAGKLHQRGPRPGSSRQRGGNPVLSALPTLAELAVPGGLTLANHYAHEYYGEEQVGGASSLGNFEEVAKDIASSFPNPKNIMSDIRSFVIEDGKTIYHPGLDRQVPISYESLQDIVSIISYLKPHNAELRGQQGGVVPIVAGVAGVSAARSHIYDKEQDAGCPALVAAASDLAVPAVLTASAHWMGRDKEQEGGNPLLLKAASDLAVPLGLTVGAHWLGSVNKDEQIGGSSQNRRRGRRAQRGGNIGNLLLQTAVDLSVPIALTFGAHALSKREQKQAEQAGGAGSLLVIDDPILTSYLGSQGIGLLTVQTLIPLGVLLAVYYAYKKRFEEGAPSTTVKFVNETQTGGAEADVLSLVNGNDLQRYMTLKGITEITPQTCLPFAAIMGADVFKDYVDDLEASSGSKQRGQRNQRRQGKQAPARRGSKQRPARRR
jgi:hypothetical protein